MKRRALSRHLVAATALLLLGACGSGSNAPVHPGTAGTGAPAGGGTNGGAGTNGAAGSATGPGAAGQLGAAGDTGQAGSGVTGGAGTGAGGSGAGGTGGSGAAGAGTAGATGDAGATEDPPEPRPIHVTPGGIYQGNGLRLDKSKPIMGKLILYLGGFGGGTGAGGIESFVNGFGFHTYAPATQTSKSSAPDMYKNPPLAGTPEANRQVGDARMELWDGVDRVDWLSVAPGKGILQETIAALQGAVTADPGGDWGYFLNADGTLRTTDVWVVGYSWGSQTWAMISSYVRFGRVICTSGPQAEGFPDATWITHPSATPNDRKYTLLGFNQPYPSTEKIDAAPNDVMSMIDTTTKAGWLGPPINVKPGDTGPFMSAHQIAMVGSDANSPPGHTVFCTDNKLNGWIPVCKYVFNVQ